MCVSDYAPDSRGQPCGCRIIVVKLGETGRRKQQSRAEQRQQELGLFLR